MRSISKIGCWIAVIWALTLVGCSTAPDQSRHFVINIEDATSSTIMLDLETLVEKSNNAEDATSTTDMEGKLSIPATAL